MSHENSDTIEDNGNRPEDLSKQTLAIQELDRRLQDGRLQLQNITKVKGVAGMWQPSGLLPDFEHGVPIAEINELRSQMARLSPEIMVALVGDTVTEEGLPIFTSALYTMEGLPSGDGNDSYNYKGGLQEWIRTWTAEENRHGDVLDRLLMLSGRVDMGAYERTKQLFISDGMELGTGNDPYKIFYYTSFQERATQISHVNVARHANDTGNSVVARICGVIANDENRHARAYRDFMKVFLEMDPDGVIKAISEMMKSGVQMPAHNMREVMPDGTILEPGETYEFFSDIAQREGVYTTQDYAKISGDLLEEWGIAEREGKKWKAINMPNLSEAGQDHQSVIVRLQNVIDRKASTAKVPNVPEHKFSWLVSHARK